MREKNSEEAVQSFVAREVYACQSLLVEELLGREIVSYEDIINLYRPFDGALLSPIVCVACHHVAHCLDSETGECRACYAEHQYVQEIYEWWVVSEWLGEKLQAHGEPLLLTAYGSWWGRCVTGQSIFLDSVIQIIYEEVIEES